MQLRNVTLLGVIFALAALTLPAYRSGLTAQVVDPCAPLVNPVACENSLPGNPASEWDVAGAGSASIQGFATEISVNRGETVRFKINTDAAGYRLDIYRLGYYAGLGARKQATVTPSVPLPQAQPACTVDGATGLVDCGVWAESASWTVPSNAVSGIYIARLVRTDGTTGASHIVFVVRDDAGGSDLLFQTSDTTWQAYNRYGGNSLYTGSPAGRAYKVSYNRPFTTREYAPEDWVFNAEYPMVRFLEANGYDVSYTTGIDTDRRGAEILEHKVFLSVGHDEYWSGDQRANVEAARDAGVHLAFFSGNEMFWKTRWELSIDGNDTPYRTLVSYKDTHANAKIDPLAGVWTGTWRDARFSPPNDGGRPENTLTGQLFMVTAGTSAIEVPAAEGQFRLWRNTSIATLAPGTFATLAAGSLGYEWDEAPAAGAPAGLVRLSRTTRGGVEKLQDNGSTYASGTATHSLTLYRAGSGALVFGAGTVQWSWGLDEMHDRTPSVADGRMQQATVNLFADMGVQPGTLQNDLVAGAASADTVGPATAITSPAANAAVLAGSSVTIAGTATDVGGVVAGIEVSTDNGATWNPASGTSSWTFTWTPAVAGPTTLFSRAVDDSGNTGALSAAVPVTVTASLPSGCPCTLWDDAVVPATPDAGADGQVELGMKFSSDIDGYITGIRFYKSAANIDTHVGSLWTSTGTRLATVTFTNETASGWQTALLATPVAITANTTYVVSYNTITGHYAFAPGYFASSGREQGPLNAPAAGSTGNGVYRYGANVFPNETYNATNYWVDVVFNTTPDNDDTSAPIVTATTPAAGATNVGISTVVTATFNEAVDPTTVTPGNVELRNSGGGLVSATVAYTAATHTLSLTPAAPLASGSTYTVTVRGGANGIADLSGNRLGADAVWSFTIVGDTTPPTVTSVAPIAGSGSVSPDVHVLAVFSEAVAPATVNGSTVQLRDASGTLVAASVSYDAGSRTATLVPAAPLAALSQYVASVVGGSAGVADLDGNRLAGTMTWSFTTAAAAPTGCPCTLFDASTTPAVVDGGDGGAVELGVKFRSDADGYITGIRFYKSAANTGTHIGNLWSANGTRLATVTFVNETGSGWQQAMFSAPVAITANTVYVASYYAPNGHYSFNGAFYNLGFDSAPLHAVANSVSPNGVYQYGPASTFPSGSYNSANYWVDVIYSATPGGSGDTTAPSVASVSPINGALGIGTGTSLSATFSEALDGATINGSTFELRAGGQAVPATVSWNAGTRTAVLQPASALGYSTTYTVRLRGGVSSPRITDLAGNAMAADYTWSFTTGAQPVAPPTDGPGGPILIVADPSNPFSRYYGEILKTEGLNAYAIVNLSTVTPSLLAGYDIVLLSEVALSASQVQMFTNYAQAGGNLIAMRPDKQLAGLLGLADAGTTLAEGYLRFGSTGAGAGLVQETIQFHGSADQYFLNDAVSVATLYSDASTSTMNPAVSLRALASGGQVSAFTYDLARSVVYTRQGNPAWASQERDGQQGIRSSDMFAGGGAQADWVDFTRVAIPQADEQMRLLKNLIVQMTLSRKPLPSFWYFPRGLKAVVVMTGDDHARGGTAGRFESQLSASTPGCSVDDWECIRSTSYVYPGTPLTAAEAAAYTAAGFEVALHATTQCNGVDAATLNGYFETQLAEFRTLFPTVPAPVTNRTHCVLWNDYTSEAEVERANGIRLDTTYYYWPDTWIADRPGLFTGSGMPMRFAKATGETIDVFQAPTQMTDESGQTYPETINALLDKALGPEGFYGAFVANMHTDLPVSTPSDQIITAARARGVPVISAKQLLTWLDGRNASSFNSIVWTTGIANAQQGGSTLSFSITAAEGTNGLQAMLPTRLAGGIGVLTALTRDGAPVSPAVQVIKGIEYAVFPAAPGAYAATYDTTAPVTTLTAAPATITNETTASFTFSANEVGSTFECSLNGAPFASCASPVAFSGLGTATHTFRVRAGDAAGNVDQTPVTHTWTVETIAPVITERTPAPGATGVALNASVTVQFSEAVNAATVTAGSVRLRRAGAQADLAATVTTSGASVTLLPSAGLLLGTGYEVVVAGTVTDLAGNPMGADVAWSFTATGALTDTLTADFAAGAGTGTRVSETGDGEIMLLPLEGGEFGGSALPAGWASTNWGGGGTATVSGGRLTVNGSRVSPAASFAPGRSLEFVATFGVDGFTHVGFGEALTDFPWAIFSTGTGGTLMARTHSGFQQANTDLGGALLGAPHRFRIDWTATSVTYFVDGVQVASHPIAITTNLRPIASDYAPGGASVVIDWMRMTPYSASGLFVSRVFDAGAAALWTDAAWTSDVPAGTAAVISVRTGDTPTPDASWTAYTVVAAPGAALNLPGRYAQYRIELSSTTGSSSPAVASVTLSAVIQ